MVTRFGIGVGAGVGVGCEVGIGDAVGTGVEIVTVVAAAYGSEAAGAGEETIVTTLVKSVPAEERELFAEEYSDDGVLPLGAEAPTGEGVTEEVRYPVKSL